MATCQTAQWVSYAPYVKLTVTQSSSTGNTATLSWTLQYIASSAANTNGNGRAYTVKIGGTTVKSSTYNIDGVSGTKTVASGTHTVNKSNTAQTVSFSVSFDFDVTWSGTYGGTKSASGSISVAAKTSYTIAYNANGGSGAPASQTKWYGTTLTLSSTKPTRTGYSFQGWATSASGSVAYASGASYTANAATTLYAVWKANTYTVTYNANGGSGAPSAQTKTYGVTLTLSSTKPTRTNYTFLGWSTSSSATTATYTAGASYTANAAVTLYAVWKLAYTKPKVENVVVKRTTEDAADSDSGAYITVSFDWSTFQAVTSVTITWESAATEAVTETITASGTSGSYYNTFGDGTISTDCTYTVTITVADGGGSTPITRTVAGTKFAIDFMTGGKGVAMGKPAELEGLCDIAYQTRHYGGLRPVLLPAETDLNEVMTPNTYVGENTATYNYVNCPLTSGTFSLVVTSGGESGQVRQVLTRCHKTEPRVFERWYYTSAWGSWVETTPAQHEVLLFYKANGTNVAFGLGEAVAAFKYLEIYFSDNNGYGRGYLKLFVNNSSANIQFDLSLIEASSSATTIIRRTRYMATGKTLAPDATSAGYLQYNTSNGTHGHSSGINYIYITRVVGIR